VTTDVDAMRRFNRFYTERIGVLSERYLGQNRPLAEARLLFEVGGAGIALRELRTRLALDSGYLARLLRSLERQGLVVLSVDPSDRRSRTAALTARGRRERQRLNARSDRFAEGLLSALSEDERRRLVAALGTVHRLLRRAAITLRAADPGSAEARHCLAAYASELARRFPEGYATSDLVQAEEVRQDGACVVAREGSRPVACGFLQGLDARVDEVKHLWVDPDLRGLGVARMVLSELERRARRRKKAAVRLDTHVVLTEAIALYRSSGYVEIPPYGSNPHAGFWFEKLLDKLPP
jgi:DNA-binding MarR family transcriptional regulator/GNAT superfamily N-acetyltransferase